jgi:hypothetical protein
MNDRAGEPKEPSREELEEMRKYGVEQILVYHYKVGPYRYANPRDALAQAMREAARSGAGE